MVPGPAFPLLAATGLPGPPLLCLLPYAAPVLDLDSGQPVLEGGVGGRGCRRFGRGGGGGGGGDLLGMGIGGERMKGEGQGWFSSRGGKWGGTQGGRE